MKFEHSVIINQPVNKVFDFVTDLNNNVKWQTGILELEVTSEGCFALGSTYRCVNRFLGQRLETEGVVTDFVPERACSFRITAGAVAGESSFSFEEVDGATKFTTKADIYLNSFKIGGLLLRYKIDKQLKNDMRQLKTILENGALR